MKFRVWDKTGRMYYVGFRLSQEGGLFHDDWPDDPIPPENVEIMCRTGIKDSKGQDIYYDDILSQDTGERELATSLVDEEWIHEFLCYSGISIRPRETLKVLGNKWQNLGLLEKSEGGTG